MNGVDVHFNQGSGVMKDGQWYPQGPWVRLSSFDFTGPITTEKVAYVKEMMATHKPEQAFLIGRIPQKYSVSIDSPGGDVYAAMQLGRIFRENLVLIKLSGKDAQCASACILAWVGAPMRRIAVDQPEFVIHRPFGFASAGQDLSSASSRWKILQSDIRQYLLEMNIPTTLLDAMNEVPSEDGRELSPGELSRYLIAADDPAVTEIAAAKESQKLGISRIEYLARKRRLDECEVDPNEGNEFCMKERCDTATDAETISFCKNFVTGPHVRENLDKVRRQNN
jgi:hypothetical protein